jgi:hypothetical protein
MKRACTLIVLAIVALTAGVWMMADPSARAAQQQDADRILRHVVCFKFKESSTPEDLRRIERAFAALPGKIDAIKDFEWGTDVSVEQKAHGYTHCFLVTFASEEARAEYLPHPAHQEFVQIVGPHVEDVFVIDYWAQK